MSNGPGTRQISIELTEYGSQTIIRVTPHRAPVQAGQSVEWLCDEEAWTVDFADLTPLSSSSVHGGTIQGSTPKVVRDDALPGHYKYTVAVYDGDEIRLLDPDIWVQ